MKISVSISDEDATFLDSYARENSCPSRSAAVHEAIQALRRDRLAEAYSDAWSDWEESGEADAWETVVGDGA